MDELGRRGSDLVLHVAGYENNVPHLVDYCAALDTRARNMKNVRMLGALKQHDWHVQIASSLALIYPGIPNEFREISGIVFMEAQACGTPSIAANRGAIPETLDDAGILLGDEQTDPNQPDYIRAFADTLQALQAEDDTWKKLSRRGLERAKSLGWDDVAKQWTAHWEGLLAERSADPARLRIHFQRDGDWDAVEAVP